MPEIVECQIMTNFVNERCNDKVFNFLYYVEKGNKCINSDLIDNFKIEAKSYGKQISLRIFNKLNSYTFFFFMGMSGNWKFVSTKEWNETKFVRMRLDTIDGHSLILFGGYMGPKYNLGQFKASNRGPDPIKDFSKFKKNILDNLNNRIFSNPICDVLLDQRYFNGIGNYLRSSIIYYANINPFIEARKIIKEHPYIIEFCRDVPIDSYNFNGGQLKDWKNPFGSPSGDFKNWVFYQKGSSCKDKTGRTFWFDPKWNEFCPYKTNNKQII